MCHQETPKMIVPCEECIALAICRHKERIECTQLWEVLWENEQSSHQDIFSELNNTLLKVKSVEKLGFGIVVHKNSPHYTFKD